MSEERRKWLRDTLIGAALTEIEELVNQSRPPVFYLIGRSGHGKSSLLNAIAGKHVAEVGDTKPTTNFQTEAYTIFFPDSFATWRAFDSRGIFESTKPGGGVAQDVVDLLAKDLSDKQPDLILHVVASRETRSLAADFEAYRKIRKHLQDSIVAPPTVMILTQCDLEEPVEHWPIEESAKKLGRIDDRLNYVTGDILHANRTPIDSNSLFRGYTIQNDKVYHGVVPVCARDDGRLWNIDSLIRFIGEHIPESALLDFYQATKRKAQLRRLSQGLTRRFSGIAAGIGATPIPLSDIVILVPLQLLLVALIGGLSCRSFTKKTALEFFTASGINVAVGFGLRTLAQQLSKLIPFAGMPISSGIAGAATYGVGRAAESYFFSGEVIAPEKFKSEWNQS